MSNLSQFTGRFFAELELGMSSTIWPAAKPAKRAHSPDLMTYSLTFLFLPVRCLRLAT